MTYITVDIETDGPIPGDYSILSIGAVIVEEGLKKTFYSELKPISEKYEKERLNFLNLAREETLKFKNPKDVMLEFNRWIKKNSSTKPIFISDNNGFDWMFVCWYFWHFLDENPFGHNSTNLNSLFKGMLNDTSKSIKEIRKNLTHNALEDAKANAKVLLELKGKGLKF